MPSRSLTVEGRTSRQTSYFPPFASLRMGHPLSYLKVGHPASAKEVQGGELFDQLAGVGSSFALTRVGVDLAPGGGI